VTASEDEACPFPGLACTDSGGGEARALPNADSIMGLDVPLALRLSAVLMLGVVRVHSRQVGYLYNDCNEAVVAFQKVSTP
jgi:hypothetical protein